MLYLLIGLAEGVALVTVFTWVWALFEKRFGVFLAGVGSMAVNAVVVLAGGWLCAMLVIRGHKPLFGNLAVAGIVGLAVGVMTALSVRKLSRHRSGDAVGRLQ